MSDPTDPVLDRVLAKLDLPMTATSEPSATTEAPHDPPARAIAGEPVAPSARAKGAVKRAMRPVAHKVVARVGDLVEARARKTEELIERRIAEVRDQLRAELAEAIEEQNARLEALRAQLPR